MLSVEELGDRKPSQLLRKFQQLLDDTSTDHPVIRELFLQRLPTHVRQLITATTTATTTLTELAQMADKVMDVPAHNISAIPQRQEDSELATLRAELLEINQTLAAFTRQQNQHPTKKTQTENDTPSSSTLCWYHRRFGSKARKCQPPCTENGQVSK